MIKIWRTRRVKNSTYVTPLLRYALFKANREIHHLENGSVIWIHCVCLLTLCRLSRCDTCEQGTKCLLAVCVIVLTAGLFLCQPVLGNGPWLFHDRLLMTPATLSCKIHQHGYTYSQTETPLTVAHDSLDGEAEIMAASRVNWATFRGMRQRVWPEKKPWRTS